MGWLVRLCLLVTGVEVEVDGSLPSGWIGYGVGAGVIAGVTLAVEPWRARKVGSSLGGRSRYFGVVVVVAVVGCQFRAPLAVNAVVLDSG